MVASTPTQATPPDKATFEVIVQSVMVTIEPPSALTAPPKEALLEVIVQFVAEIMELTA